VICSLAALRWVNQQILQCACAHDQTVAEDYFAAMQRVEQRLEIVPEVKQDTEDEVVKVQTEFVQLIENLELPELCLAERLDLTKQLREVMALVQAHAPPAIQQTKHRQEAMAIVYS
jgi:hypothetical protein